MRNLLLLLTWVACREDGDPKYSVDADKDGIRSDSDCDDADPGVGAPSVWYLDADGDGWGGEVSDSSCEPPVGAALETGDCDDADPTVAPNTPETCDGRDQDCDGVVDEGLAVSTLYADADGDGFGDDGSAEVTCAPEAGDVEVGGDCDDQDALRAPGLPERCNQLDDDCDSEIDEELPTFEHYTDTDGDGYGEDATLTVDCVEDVTSAQEGGDCDDENADFYPGAPEADCEDPADYNCDGSTGYADVDGDSWAACAECDDSQASVQPDAEEVCNGIDDDCDGEIDEEGASATLYYPDLDGDGFGDAAGEIAGCTPLPGYVTDPTDCGDLDAAVFPGAEERCDGVDEDCDGEIDENPVDPGEWYNDADADGYGAGDVTIACDAPPGAASQGNDCDDADPEYHPGADESDCSDPRDLNCDGSTGYTDGDGDGFAACEECADDDPAAYPGAAERCDGIDNNCDGTIDGADAVDAALWYTDADGDGDGDGTTAAAACEAPPGTSSRSTDCDDTDGQVYFGAPELCDLRDNNCDGVTDEGHDQDGDMVADCEDTEACDGLDNDGDGQVDEAGATGEQTWYLDLDGDASGDPATTSLGCVAPEGYVADDQDCDDLDASRAPTLSEVCDGTDNDCDGAEDEGFDADLDGIADCRDLELCDGLDNDGDGDIDEADAVDASVWYADLDGDSFGDAGASLTSCEAPLGYVADVSDCDDGSAGIQPGADELCDGLDQDCDGITDEDAVDALSFYGDGDGDGFGDLASLLYACVLPAGASVSPDDCDDTDASIAPDADERCNGVDDNCDGVIDDDAVDRASWYLDEDGDGYGDVVLLVCEDPGGDYVADAGDCDDDDDAVFPGAPDCDNGVDDDCDGLIDEEGLPPTTWYQDSDGDGYGDDAVPLTACLMPADSSSVATDCDDDDGETWPGAIELCDATDQDCDGLHTDVDEDRDGVRDFGTGRLALDGYLDWVQVPDNPWLDFGTNDWTIEAWVELDDFTGYSSASSGTRILDRSTGGYPSTSWWVVDVYTTGQVEMEVTGVGAGASVRSGHSASTGMMSATRVTHVAIVVERGTNTATYYLDGVNAGVVSLSSSFLGTTVSNAAPLYIGAAWNTMQGSLDEVRLWSVARSQAEVAADMCSPLVGTEPSLIGYWPFEADLVDHGSHGLGGTAVGNAARETW